MRVSARAFSIVVAAAVLVGMSGVPGRPGNVLLAFGID
jgi:hypothetical protein